MRARRGWAVTTVAAVSVTAALLVATTRDVDGGRHAVHPQAVVSADGPQAPAPASTIADPAADAGTDAGVDAASAEATATAVRDVDAIAAASATSDIGVAVLDRETGALALGASGTATYYAASIVKLYTAVDILHRRAAGEITLTDADLALIGRALSASDDQAMNQLWSRFGGAATVTGAIAVAGLKDSAPPLSPSQWGETLVSARDVVALYDYVETALPAADRALMTAALASAPATAADGFDQAFGLLDPPRPGGVAAKQGWMWIGPEFYLHTAGVLDDRYVVALLTRNPASSAPARLLVNAAAAAVTAPLTG